METRSPRCSTSRRAASDLTGCLGQHLADIDSGECIGDTQPYDPGECYEIRVAGHLELHWSDWFEGLAITHPNETETLLSGPVVDQAALHGLLARVRDMNLELISVRKL